MSKMTKAVQGFLKSMEWSWDEIEPRWYRVIVPGEAARWVWVARWEEDDSFFVGYSLCPVKVPPRRRAAAAEYLTRANWSLRLGNFEMDYADGEVCFRTSMALAGLRPTAELVKHLAFAGFNCMDRYLPGLMSIIYGKARPKTAVEEAERPSEETEEPQEQEDEDEGDAPPPAASDRVRLNPPGHRPGVSRAIRLSQFVRYLRLMDKRAHEEQAGSSFLIFSRPADASTPAPEDPHGGVKMVQFCFERKWFAIDIPNINLCPDDAERILKQRRGFYREAEHPEVGVTRNASDLVQLDPVGKKYIYGDEREAAEDAAYVFFDVWGLPLDAELLVTASAFDGPHWEREVPLE